MELNQLRTSLFGVMPVIIVNLKSSLGQQSPFESSSYQSCLGYLLNRSLVAVCQSDVFFYQDIDYDYS